MMMRRSISCRLSSSFLASLLLFALCLNTLVGSRGVQADGKTHRYVPGEEVTLWTNKVGPYNNPQETFNYYTLPFCKAVSSKIEP